MRKLFTALVLSIALVGCAGVSVKTPAEGVAACYVTVETAFNTAADVKARGALSPEQEKKVVQAGDQALAACDAARAAMNAGDLTQAEGQLQIANALLVQLEAYLRSQGVQK